MKRLIIAIDGPAASGKSTTARLLAQKLGYVYLDTGAMYRSCALKALRLGLSLQDVSAISDMISGIDLKVDFVQEQNKLYLDGEDVSEQIRSEEISRLASAISAIPAVRLKMVELQRRIASGGGFILDGRDIGSYVFPNADLKFFINADASVRARRRLLELQAKGVTASLDEVLSELVKRDENDRKRALAPLIQVPEAIYVDTSAMDIEEQVDYLYSRVQAHLNQHIRIYLAEHSGFCFGVRRAIQMALEAGEHTGQRYTLGELIHNPIIVTELQEKGIQVCEDPAQLHNQTVILRSHGATRQDLEILTANQNTIIDASCPYVLRAQKFAETMAAEGYQIIILGNAAHPEVIGIRSWAGDDAIVLSATQRPQTLRAQKVCVISQTTEKQEHLTDLVTWLVPRCNELRVFNTICLATQQRQDATLRMAKKLPLVIVIGGRNSSNTRQLFNLCTMHSTCFQVESETQIKPQWFEEISELGLAAGASTPAGTIITVYNKIKEIKGDPDRVTAVGEIPAFKEESC